MTEAMTTHYVGDDCPGGHDEPTGTVRLLDERLPGDIRTCARCLGPIDRDAYFAGDFYCPACVERAHDFPWRTTHGGLTP